MKAQADWPAMQNQFNERPRVVAFGRGWNVSGQFGRVKVGEFSIASIALTGYLHRMAQLMISVPDSLESLLHRRVAQAGFKSDEEYIVSLVQADCEAADLEAVLESRDAGPFAPLEADWKHKVRAAAQRRG